MKSGFHIGKIFGIDIRIDWSWIFIFLLVTWNLAGVVFPSLHPNWSFAVNLGVSLAASLLFFLSVLAHELAHSLVARARGLPVRSITLFIFGGVSNIEREPPSPATEFLVSILGPLTSLLLGALFLFLGGATAPGDLLTGIQPRNLANLGPLSTILLWLGPINLVLAIFNLIPGFPLDGGRVLRSILWAITKNLRRATRWAVVVSQVVAWLFITAGIAMVLGVEIPFLGRGVISGVWLAFIGWFLNNAAVQSYQQVVINDMLEGVPVSRLMRQNVPVITPEMTISQLVDEYILGTDERAFPVLEAGSLAGLVCLEDVKKVPRSAWEETRVQQIMTPAAELDTVSPREDVTDALVKLSKRDVHQVPVVQAGQLIGMLRKRDIMRWLEIRSGMAN